MKPAIYMIAWGLVVAGGLTVAFFYAKKAVSTRNAVTPAYVGFEPAELDLGTHLWKQSVQFSLNFVNRSEDPIALAALTTSCGCTFIDVDRYRNKVIAPSETLTIEVSLDTQQTPGLKSRNITVELADGATYTASVLVDVKATYFLDSRLLNFGTLPESTSAVRRSVSFVSDSVTLVGDPRIDGRWLSAAYVKRDESQTDIVISVAPEKLAYGLNIGSVIIQTSDDVIPRASIRVIAKGGQGLRSIPAHLFLRDGETKTVKFLDAVDGSQTRILTAFSDDELVQAEVDDDGNVLVRAEIGAGARLSTVRVAGADGRIGKALVSTFKGE